MKAGISDFEVPQSRDGVGSSKFVAQFDAYNTVVGPV
jgi:hypothetical protein